MGSTVQKRPGELKVGDKILGNTNYYLVKAVRPSPLTGVTCPILDLEDSHGEKRTIDTGASEKWQNHLFECWAEDSGRTS